MSRFLQIAHLALLLSAGALCVCGCVVLLRAVDVLATFKADGVKLGQTIDLINRPCGGGHPCGTLATVNKAFVKAGDAIVTTQLQERAITPAITNTMASLSSAVPSITKTADAYARLAQTATGTFQTADTTIQGFQPVSGQIIGNLTALHGTIESANTLISDPKIPALIANASGTVNHLDMITGDAATAYHNWLHPPPCKNFRCKMGRFVSYLPDVTRGIQAAEAAKSLFSGTHIYGTVTVKKGKP